MTALAKTNSRSRVKKGPLRDLKHRQRVNGLRCCVCNHPPPCEAHHIREAYPRTMGVRIGDDKVIPLCDFHHDWIHRHQKHEWQQTDINVKAIAAALYAETLSLRGEANPNAAIAKLKER